MPTFFPALLYISGFSRVLQTLWRMVVFPAFALPITRIRKRPIFSLILEGSMEEGKCDGEALISSSLIIVAVNSVSHPSYN
jgi:hypothetical protein